MSAGARRQSPLSPLLDLDQDLDLDLDTHYQLVHLTADIMMLLNYLRSNPPKNRDPGFPPLLRYRICPTNVRVDASTQSDPEPPSSFQSEDDDLITEVVETMLNARAPSTRKLYTLKWWLFVLWCEERQLDPVNCTIATVLEFLQEHFSGDLAPSTIRVYVAAISTSHSPVDGASVGQHPLTSTFMRGVRQLRPICRARIPSWDLSVILEGLSGAPFEPLESASGKLLTLKVALLLSLTSLKRVGDLQALSVAPSCLDFAPGLAMAFLYLRPDYIPKVPTSAAHPVVLQAFCPPPFLTPEQERMHLLRPVMALCTYVHRSCQWCKSEQLLFFFGGNSKGDAVSKQSISNWIVEAISMAYEARGLATPLGIRAHSTRAVASSKALLKGVSLQDVCAAAGWSTPHTFIRYYSL
ncbi:uncharacterized protein LOC128634035, partial [Ictalurus punctatus]|uniref:Uncharacterized protein LOC128634035 n=1 Tax=Ictalurus punctatus TaxID=7998 RepID=A0A9F7TP06_ICTPU